MPKINRLFKVTCHCDVDDGMSYKLEARDDLVARAGAVLRYVADVNKQQDDLYRQDKAEWTSGDAPLKASNYRHITEKDVTYCETDLLEEW